MYNNNLDLLLDLKRQLEAVIDKGNHRLECISRACESGRFNFPKFCVISNYKYIIFSIKS